MNLWIKLAVAGVGVALGLKAVQWYFWVLHGEYYFPGRYEDAYAAMALAVLVSILALAAVVVSHMIISRR
jgi:hypothetical protein